MARNTRVGKLPPRYGFILNPHAGTRLSKCPLCGKPTHPRKLGFFIFIDGWGPMALGKTCKYCSRCELIMMHQDELEAELTYSFSKFAPEVIGNEYLVMGTIERRVWQKGVEGDQTEVEDILKHVADFKKVYDLEYDPGGWYPADAGQA